MFYFELILVWTHFCKNVVNKILNFEAYRLKYKVVFGIKGDRYLNDVTGIKVKNITWFLRGTLRAFTAMIVLQLSITRRHFVGFYSAFCHSLISCAPSKPRGEDFGQIFAIQLNFWTIFCFFCTVFSFSVSGYYVTAVR